MYTVCICTCLCVCLCIPPPPVDVVRGWVGGNDGLGGRRVGGWGEVTPHTIRGGGGGP